MHILILLESFPPEIKSASTLFFELAYKAKQQGLLPLEADLGTVKDPFIKQGLRLILDGTDPELVKSIMDSALAKRLREMKATYEAVITGVLSVQAGDNPMIVRERLDAMI